MMGYNYAQAKAAAAAADAADEAAAEAAILAAKSSTVARTASSSAAQDELDDFSSFQNNNTGSISTAGYQRLVTNDESATPVDRQPRHHSNGIGNGPSLDEDEEWTCGYCNHFHSSFKFRCVGCTRYNVSRSSDDASYDDNNVVLCEKDNAMEENDDDSSSSCCSEEMKSWECFKCQHYETKSTSRCSNCKGWRGGKRPTKNQVETLQSFPIFDTNSDEECEFTTSLSPNNQNKNQHPPAAIRSKKNLKPLFEINDRVYGPWWPDNDRDSDPSWYSGVITNYITVKHGKYGPVRHYDVLYDDDGEEVTEIDDHFIFSREDYVLTTSSSGRKGWVGVVNVLDGEAQDSWAEIVGWYDATIDGNSYSFSRLVDALRAYDAYILKKKGKEVSPSELNQPDEILRAELGRIPISLSKPNESTDYSLNYIGVSFHRQSKTYEAYIYYQKESSIGRKRSLGRYILAADAALARDVCSDQLGISSPSNFPQQAEYDNARANEIKERGMEVSSEEVMSYLNDMVRKVVSTVAEKEEDDLSEASSDEEFDVDGDFDNSLDISTHGRGRIPSSGYPGVYFLKDKGKYLAYIHHNKRYSVASNFILAADASYARDECLKKLGVSYKPNFADKSEYICKRKKEMAERGLDVSLKVILARVTSKVNKVIAKVARDNNATSSLDIPPNHDERNKRYSSNYIGVSYSTSKGKYVTYTPKNKESKYKIYCIGFYVLAADGAYARDLCLRQLDETCTLNFANVSDYNDARRKELQEKGLTVAKQEVEAYMESKVNSVLSKLRTDHGAQLDNANSPSEDQDTVSISDELPGPKQNPQPKNECTSKYNGVCLDKSRGCYVARLMHEGTNFNLGSFELSVDAALIYDVCVKILKGKGYGKINFAKHSQYTSARSQEMNEKGIVLSEDQVLEAIKVKRKHLLSKVANSKSNETSRIDNEVAKDSAKTNHHEEQHSAQVSLDSTETTCAKPRNVSEQSRATSQSNTSTCSKHRMQGQSTQVQNTPTTSNPPKQPSKTQDLPKIPRVGLLASITARVKATKHGLAETSEVVTNKKPKSLPSPTHSVMHLGGDVSVTFDPPSPEHSKQTALETKHGIPVKSESEGIPVRRIKKEDTLKLSPSSPTKSILKNKEESPTKASPLLKPAPPAGLDVSNLILLTADQCQAAPFQVGTPVWWESEGNLNEGQVNGVYFDTTARDLRYTVNSKLHTDPLFMTANDLSYAPSTSIFVSTSLWETGSQSALDMLSKGGSLLKGRVLLSKKNRNSNGDVDWVYTVTIEHAHGIRIVENVPSCNVTRRL